MCGASTWKNGHLLPLVQYSMSCIGKSQYILLLGNWIPVWIHLVKRSSGIDCSPHLLEIDSLCRIHHVYIKANYDAILFSHRARSYEGTLSPQRSRFNEAQFLCWKNGPVVFYERTKKVGCNSIHLRLAHSHSCISVGSKGNIVHWSILPFRGLDFDMLREVCELRKKASVWVEENADRCVIF